MTASKRDAGVAFLYTLAKCRETIESGKIFITGVPQIRLEGAVWGVICEDVVARAVGRAVSRVANGGYKGGEGRFLHR